MSKICATAETTISFAYKGYTTCFHERTFFFMMAIPSSFACRRDDGLMDDDKSFASSRKPVHRVLYR